MITALEWSERESPAFEGAEFGAPGPYEALYGTARGALDPADPLNAVILNLDKAPRNAVGLVDYAVDLTIYKPLELTRGNRRLFLDLPNRGNKRALAGNISGGRSTNRPQSKADLGPGFFLERGYAVVCAGWQGGLPPGNDRMLAHLPVASNGGEPITGTGREEFIDEGDPGHADRITHPPEVEGKGFVGAMLYPAASLDPAQATLTVRLRADDERQTPPDLRWRYRDERHIEVMHPAGFDRGALYEFVYPAKDPLVLGVGYTAIRDLVSFLRYESADAVGTPNPLAVEGRPFMEKAIAVGISQCGRFLGGMLEHGCNEDEAHRQVLDGMVRVVTGIRRANVNLQFAIPGNYSRQHETHLTPDALEPHAYETRTDPITGHTGGLLEVCRRSGHVPKIMQLDTEAELWQGRGSLLVYDGEQTIPQPDNVRLYLVASAQHSVHLPPTPHFNAYPGNPLDYAPILRALIVALDEWVTNGTEPPASRFPSIADGTLVPPHQAGFPDIPGMPYPGVVNRLRPTDFSVEPPLEHGNPYPIRVNRTDADGNGVAGIRHPFLAAPRGTHTGWSVRAEGYAAGEMASTHGAFFPFARTRAERLAAGDPRPALEERYPTQADYMARLREAADRLVRARLLLPADADRVVAEGAAFRVAPD